MTAIRTIAAIRFGFGLPLPAGAPDTADAMLVRLAGPDIAAQDWPIGGLEQAAPLLIALKSIKKEGKSDAAQAGRRDDLLTQIAEVTYAARIATFGRILDAPDGFRERLVSFWANHFSVVARNPAETFMPFALVEDAIRPHLTARFSDLLAAVTLHPAMLLYLDQSASVGPNSGLGKKQSKGLNENLAREVIELHSLGVDAGYAQDDVRQMAELLTGLVYQVDAGTVFLPRRAEPGPETVLGKTYQGEGLAMIREALGDLGKRPETAVHIAKKLVVHFISDHPDPDLVAAVAAAFVATDGDLMAVYTALLSHPAAWQDQMEKIRQPFDFILVSARALGLSGKMVQNLNYRPFQRIFLKSMQAMGQPFKAPNGPNGFPEAADAWITPQALASRITWAMQEPQQLLDVLPDPVAMAQSCLADRASPALLLAVSRSEDIREGVGLILASAEFNRR